MSPPLVGEVLQAVHRVRGDGDDVRRPVEQGAASRGVVMTAVVVHVVRHQQTWASGPAMSMWRRTIWRSAW